MFRKILIVVLTVVLASGAGFALKKMYSDTKEQEPAVLSATTDRFKSELQACLAYNQQLYEHDRQKIERTDPGNTGNPKEARLKDLAAWFQFEQEACQQSYEDRLKYWEQTR
jgi:hypothetical protein